MTSKFNAETKRVLTFTLSYLGIATVWAIAASNKEFLFYIGVLFVLIPLVWVLHRRVTLSTGALWCLSLWGLSHMAGGLIPVPEGWPIRGENLGQYNGEDTRHRSWYHDVCDGHD